MKSPGLKETMVSALWDLSVQKIVVSGNMKNTEIRGSHLSKKVPAQSQCSKHVAAS